MLEFKLNFKTFFCHAQELKESSKPRLRLNDLSQKKLTELLHRWPLVCKSVLELHPGLKAKLQAAAQAQAEQTKAAIAGARDTMLQVWPLTHFFLLDFYDRLEIYQALLW